MHKLFEKDSAGLLREVAPDQADARRAAAQGYSSHMVLTVDVLWSQEEIAAREAEIAEQRQRAEQRIKEEQAANEEAARRQQEAMAAKQAQREKAATKLKALGLTDDEISALME